MGLRTDEHLCPFSLFGCYQLEKIARIVCLMSVLHVIVQGKLYWVKMRPCPPDNPFTCSGAGALLVL